MMRFLALIFMIFTLSACAHTKLVPVATEIHPPEILMKAPQKLSPIIKENSDEKVS